jgi:hypothetical protein
MLNALDYAGITLDMSASKLFQKLKYKDEEGRVCTVEPPPFDLTLTDDAARVMRMRGFFAWHRQLSRKFLVPITKDMYQAVQAEIFTSVKCHGVQLQSSSSMLLGIPTHVIDKIIGCELAAGEVWERQ